MATPINLADLQTAIGNMLAGDAGVTAQLGSHDGRISDGSDPDIPLPNVTLGDSEARDDSVQFLSAKQIYFPVHIWTEEKGFGQNKRIEAAIVALLDQDDPQWVIPGLRVVSSFHLNTRFMNDLEDGVRHGVAEFEMSVEPA